MNQKNINDQNNFAESMLKGRMAETLVEELLRKSGNTVYRFGYEAILQNLSQIKKAFDVSTEVGKKIRALPDFIVIDTKGDPIFLEVKFRANGVPHDDTERLARIKKFWNAKMIFVNCSKKPFFMVSDPPYFGEDGRFISKPLIKEEGWKIDREVYEKYESLVEKYLGKALV
jgi:hypothetical protein